MACLRISLQAWRPSWIASVRLQFLALAMSAQNCGPPSVIIGMFSVAWLPAWLPGMSLEVVSAGVLLDELAPWASVLLGMLRGTSALAMGCTARSNLFTSARGMSVDGGRCIARIDAFEPPLGRDTSTSISFLPIVVRAAALLHLAKVGLAGLVVFVAVLLWTALRSLGPLSSQLQGAGQQNLCTGAL